MANLTDIKLGDPRSWEGKRFITLDIDWAPDFAVEFCIELILEATSSVTVFLTHEAPWLGGARQHDNFEWGVHPNFERALQPRGETQSGLDVAREVLCELADWAPSMQLLRPHGLMTAGRWLPLYAELGVTHLSSVYPRLQVMPPYAEYNGITQVPIHWSDTGHLYLSPGAATPATDLERRMTTTSFSVLLFHPIHVFLNTESLEHYEAARNAVSHQACRLQDLRSSRGNILPSFLAALDWATT